MLRLLLPLLALAAAQLPAQPVLEIIRASYGARSTFADVTERVRSQVVNGTIAMQVNADTLGGDPLPNTPKTLTVQYRLGNARRTIRVNDFDTLRLGTPTAPALRITRAQYGDGRRMRDVTPLLSDKIKADRLELVVSNANLGGDPAPAERKMLVVDYEYNGRPASVRAAEGETLVLPVAAQAAPSVSSLRILRAVYGGGRRGTADVTSVVAARVANNALDLLVNADTLGMDPAAGVVKTLTVDYEYNGQRATASARDGEALRVNVAVPVIRIIRATYGAGRRGAAEVTNTVSSRLSANTLELPVTTAVLGVDPAPNTVKTLTVEYEQDGRRLTASARDGETLRLPGGIVTAAPAAPIIRILRATYGAGRRSQADVTNAVAARVANNVLTLSVNAETLGIDPAAGQVKTLTVEYQQDGRQLTASARDGEMLRLPTDSSAITPALAAGPCLYRQTDYGGESICLAPGQALPAIANWQYGFRSLRLNGAASVELFDRPNYSGRAQVLNADSPDLLQWPNTWWRYDGSVAAQSIRAR